MKIYLWLIVGLAMSAIATSAETDLTVSKVERKGFKVVLTAKPGVVGPKDLVTFTVTATSLKDQVVEGDPRLWDIFVHSPTGKRDWNIGVETQENVVHVKRSLKKGDTITHTKTAGVGQSGKREWGLFTVKARAWCSELSDPVWVKVVPPHEVVDQGVLVNWKGPLPVDTQLLGEGTGPKVILNSQIEKEKKETKKKFKGRESNMPRRDQGDEKRNDQK